MEQWVEEAERQLYRTKSAHSHILKSPHLGRTRTFLKTGREDERQKREVRNLNSEGEDADD